MQQNRTVCILYLTSRLRLGPVPPIVMSSARRQHIVQFYTADAAALVRNVGKFLLEGLRKGESAIAIATPDHARDFERELSQAGCDVEAAVAERRLLVLDAQQSMARFMTDGRPDWSRFVGTADAAFGQLAAGTGVRAYGEMVGVLWEAGQYSAAIVLEDYWNRYLRENDFPLFCAYPIDVFDREFQMCGVEALLCDHTHVMSSGAPDVLDRALNRAIGEHIGVDAADIRLRVSESSTPSWATIQPAEATMLWLRTNAPEHADSILDRARQYYKAATA